MGVLMASTRVYVNEGMAHDLWVSTTWALNPFDLKESIRRNFKTRRIRPHRYSSQGSKQPVDADREENAEHGALPHHLGFFPLKDAIEIDRAGTPRKDGKDYLTADAEVLKRGKIAFADNCASCHSSKTAKPDAGRLSAAKAGMERSCLAR